MALIDLLLSNGWECYRKKFISNQWVYEPTKFNHKYSSLEEGGLDYRFLKNGDNTYEVIYGLNERHSPPTLQWPTLFIPRDPKNRDYPSDAEKSKYVLQNTPDKIYQDILNFYNLKND